MLYDFNPPYPDVPLTCRERELKRKREGEKEREREMERERERHRLPARRRGVSLK